MVVELVTLPRQTHTHTHTHTRTHTHTHTHTDRQRDVKISYDKSHENYISRNTYILTISWPRTKKMNIAVSDIRTCMHAR